jgi:hypothetical protein
MMDPSKALVAKKALRTGDPARVRQGLLANIRCVGLQSKLSPSAITFSRRHDHKR